MGCKGGVDAMSDLEFSVQAILKRLRDALQNPVNKIEGGFSMDNLQAVSEELARMDAMEVQPIPDRVLLDTAEGEYLDRRALDYAETRNPAVAASGSLLFTGSAGVQIPAGTEAAAGVLVFETTQEGTIGSDGTCLLPAVCQTPGSAGNVPAGAINILRTVINGITTVTNPESFGGGADAESDESFRSRIFDKIRRPITSGNRNHYIYWAKQVSGVGGAKCLGAEVCGAGMVKVIVLSDTLGIPDEAVLQRVEEHIQEERPIGPQVEIVSASPVDIAVSVTIKAAEGYGISSIKAAAQAALQEYVDSVNKADFDMAPSWQDENRTSTVSYYRIGSLLFDIPGVEDILSYTLNGDIASVESGYTEFFRLGEVVVSAAD